MKGRFFSEYQNEGPGLNTRLHLEKKTDMMMIEKSHHYDIARMLFERKAQDIDLCIMSESVCAIHIAMHPGWDDGCFVMHFGDENNFHLLPNIDRHVAYALSDMLRAWADADALNEFAKGDNNDKKL